MPLVKKLILVIIRANSLESAISGKAAIMSGLLKSHVDEVVITVTFPSSTSRRKVGINTPVLII